MIQSSKIALQQSKVKLIGDATPAVRGEALQTISPVINFFCVSLKNNLRRINCTVMEVKYLHSRSRQTPILAAHLLRVSHSAEGFCSELAHAMTHAAAFSHSRVLHVFFSSCLFCSTSAYLSAPITASCQITGDADFVSAAKCLPPVAM